MSEFKKRWELTHGRRSGKTVEQENMLLKHLKEIGWTDLNGMFPAVGLRPTMMNVIEFHKNVLNIPIRVERDIQYNWTIILAHRKTHKRVKKFMSYWKPIDARIRIEHTSWENLKGN